MVSVIVLFTMPDGKDLNGICYYTVHCFTMPDGKDLNGICLTVKFTMPDGKDLNDA